MSDDETPVNKIAAAITTIGLGWSLSFIGEDQAGKLGTLTQDLRRGYSETGDGKQIASGFSYWGIGPTIAWIMACKDPLYPVMNESTKHFAGLWANTLPYMDERKYHYVSLGVGSGEKDNLILKDLHRLSHDIYYFPVDMSPEMLRLGAREAIRHTGVERAAVLPIQIDFSVHENVIELRSLLDSILGSDPILFSLLGNTLSNFNADTDLLETLSLLVRPQDRLLLEVASTTSLTEDAQKQAADEYDRSQTFKEFVTSSLFQNTDLAVDLDSVSFVGSAEQHRAILIKTIYRNDTGTKLSMTLPDRTRTAFAAGDTIRLSTIRKYTPVGIAKLTSDCGFTVIRKIPLTFARRHRSFAFGTELLLLEPGLPKLSDGVTYEWDIFLAHPGTESQLAEILYELLKDRCRIFLDTKCLTLGDDWDHELGSAQSTSMVTVVMVSADTDKAYYQREEIAAAIALARQSKSSHRIIPLFVGEIPSTQIPYGLRLKHGLHCRDASALASVADELAQLIDKLRHVSR